MKKLLIGAGVLTLSTTTAMAGGIDRMRTDTGLLFEAGNRIKLSFNYADPDVSGTYNNPAFGPFVGTSTGNMAETFFTAGFGYKRDLNDRWAIALLIDEPYAADASYTQGPYAGLLANWTSESISLLAKYRIDDNWSVFGGPRAVRSRASITIPSLLGNGAALSNGLPATFGTDYEAVGPNETDFGVVLGAAYEIPAIALRVALSYQSEISHSFASTEFVNGAVVSGTTEIDLPQAVTLDFQTGVAADTLVFGSVRWSEWSVYDVRTPQYLAQTGDSVTSIDDDVWSLSLGVGRRINESLSLFARIGYEEQTGTVVSRLAPTDGRRSIGVGGTYTVGNLAWTGGVEYIDLGDAVDSAGTTFDGNDALAYGLSVSISF